MKITIPEAVSQMLAIVDRLCLAYPKKRFTLDGRLVGDIGEVLVEAAYDLDLFEDVKRHHDATARDGRLVQIKATMKKHLTFPGDHVPDYYLGVQLHKDGTFTEVFNGPGADAQQAVKGRAISKTNLHSVSISALRALQVAVPVNARIPLRTPSPVSGSVDACQCCAASIPVTGGRVCPMCGHEFRGNGWDGIDVHWKARHESVMAYSDFWGTLCSGHRAVGTRRKRL
jgi:hypothetical protein